MFPRGNASDGDFGNKDVNVRIPLKAAAKSMKDTDKAGSKSFGFIQFAEHVKDDVANGMKEATEQRTISTEEDAELFRNGTLKKERERIAPQILRLTEELMK